MVRVYVILQGDDAKVLVLDHIVLLHYVCLEAKILDPEDFKS